MNDSTFGFLKNNAQKRNYKTPDSPENVIRYIIRANKYPKPGLLTWGGIGILQYTDIDSIVQQFNLVSKMNTRHIKNNRFIDHEWFSFNDYGENILYQNNINLARLAWEMASDFYEIDNCQVLYGVHIPDENASHLHIHFAINTFDLTGHKRRENTRQTAERNARFQQIIAAVIQESMQK